MCEEKDRESYLRWQQLAITQLGYTINLFLTYTGAILGFVVAFLIRSNPLQGNTQGTLFSWSLIFLCLSFAGALAANFTRAKDFRYTRRALRERMINGKDHDKYHDKAECYGKWTWWLFYGQTVTFGLGDLFLVISIWCLYGSRL